MNTTAPVMDGLQHILAYGVAGLILFFLVSLLGGLEKAWSAIDISDNIAKFKKGLRDIEDQTAGAWLHAVGYGALAVILFYFAWHFDLSSSWDYSSSLRDKMAKTMGGAAASAYLLAGVTYLPTLMEMFGAKFAKLNVFWVQLFVIGLAIFDLFTDLPRVREYIEPYYGTFVSADNGWMTNILFEGLYYVVFGLWWLFASYGFEAMTVCFAFAALGCVVKATIGSSDAAPSKGGRRQAMAD